MYAVIANGGKQYKVTVGEVVRLEKIKSEHDKKFPCKGKNGCPKGAFEFEK